MSKIFNLCNLYIALWVIYFLQGSLYTSGSSLSQGVLLLNLLIGCFATAKVHVWGNMPIFFKALDLFILMIFIYGICYIAAGTDYFLADGEVIAPYVYIKNILISLLPIYTFYYFTRQDMISVTWLQCVSILLIAITIVEYYRQYQEQLLLFEEEKDEVTNNTSYTFLALVPILVFWRKHKIWQFTWMLVISYFIVMGMKRGAIAIGAICLLYFLYTSMKEASIKGKILISVLTVASIFIGIYFIQDLYDTSEYFAKRVEDTVSGNTSGRDLIYQKLINFLLNEQTDIHTLIGSGANYTIQVAGNYAHQDWLELAVNNGLVGIITYLIFFIYLYRSIMKYPRRSMAYQALMISLIILGARSMFSMGYSDVGLGMSITLGVCLAQRNWESKTLKNG